MKINKTLLFYALTIGGLGLLIWLLFQQGALLEAGRVVPFPKPGTDLPPPGDTSMVAQQPAGAFASFLAEFSQNLHHPLSILLLQIAAIIIFARIFGYIFTKIGQPTVIGEIVAGIVLGPSVVGMFFPAFSAFLFPVQSLGNLQFLSQLGLILFMFVIGMELDIKVLKNKAHAAVIISHASIIFPYFLGTLLAYYLYLNYTPDNISFLSFALFMGIAMSITAFPVLARVIQERGLTQKSLGILAITCAAADDVTAWCILAAVIAIVKAGTFGSALFTLGFSLAYVICMIYILQPFLNRLGAIYISRETITKPVIAFVFLVLLLSSFLTEIIGIHALFGAFLAGVIMPQNIHFKKLITDKIEDVSLVLLLPLFFVLTGLRTQIGLLNDGKLWIVCVLVILVAVAGKFGGSAIAARFVGQSWKDALSIGALMNTRGLMELIVLNIGYDLGILTPEIFAIMVLMALITTFMTGPSLDLINYFCRKNQAASLEEEVPAPAVYRILISFGPAKMGTTLLRLATQITVKEKPAEITALHISPNPEIKPQDAIIYEKESFTPIKATAQELGIAINTSYKTSRDVGREIIQFTNRGHYDLLLVGSAKRLFSNNQIGGIIQGFLNDTQCTVGVLIDNGFKTARKVLLLVHAEDDKFLVHFAERFIINIQSTVTVMPVEAEASISFLQPETIDYPAHANMEVVSSRPLDPPYLQRFDIILISLHHWEKLSSMHHDSWTSFSPSILIIKLNEDFTTETSTMQSSHTDAL